MPEWKLRHLMGWNTVHSIKLGEIEIWMGKITKEGDWKVWCPGFNLDTRLVAKNIEEAKAEAFELVKIKLDNLHNDFNRYYETFIKHAPSVGQAKP